MLINVNPPIKCFSVLSSHNFNPPAPQRGALKAVISKNEIQKSPKWGI